MEKNRVIAIPMGDAAGVGPEIIVKALADPRLRDIRAVVIGDRNILEQACRICNAPLTVRVIASPAEADFSEGILNLIDLGCIDMERFAFGKVSGMCGRAAYDCIAEAIRLTVQGDCAVVATPPINKESLRAGGVSFIGHTEIFGALTGTADPLTMFEVHGMRVFFLTRHLSLRQACDGVTKERIIDYVQRCGDALRQLGVIEGSMAIAALNPHCGEHGLFGDEEMREVVPAVAWLKAHGYAVTGPIGADSVFHLAKQGRFSSVLSLYHDQGHIACKTLDFDRTISMTLGMPILRTSVDHGTAFDIAGTGTANETGMIEAILVADRYAPNFSR